MKTMHIDGGYQKVFMGTTTELWKIIRAFVPLLTRDDLFDLRMAGMAGKAAPAHIQAKFDKYKQVMPSGNPSLLDLSVAAMRRR